jgi:hypothetical protein
LANDQNQRGLQSCVNWPFYVIIRKVNTPFH